MSEKTMIRLKIKEVAAAKGVSQRKLSLRSEVDIKTVQKIYRYPYSIVTTETLDKLAKVLLSEKESVAPLFSIGMDWVKSYSANLFVLLHFPRMYNVRELIAC